MITTRVFNETLAAYNAGYRVIANRGGTRSSKTFSELQLFKLIQTYSKNPRIITVVSHSFPHLHSGAIRDYESILETDGINIDAVRTKNPYLYNINKNIVEFVGFDRPGKALGAARDILLINEADRMPFSVCHQLMQRTKEAIFLDWNPANDFWFDEQEFEKRKDCIVITSTFYDNIKNLTPGQLSDLKEARRKAIDEDSRGIRGYWWNWWQVYGLGQRGQLEGVIFQNWKLYEDLPEGDYYKLFAVDWGGNDPTVLVELNFKDSEVYVREHIYQAQILNSKLIEILGVLNQQNCPVICDSARKDKIYELQMAGINAFGSTKGEGSVIEGIERMMELNIHIHKDSANTTKEFNSYKWVKDETTGKTLNEPEDANNHSIDSIRYGVRFYRRNIRPLK
jgi:phage terminase large subunit